MVVCEPHDVAVGLGEIVDLMERELKLVPVVLLVALGDAEAQFEDEPVCF